MMKNFLFDTVTVPKDCKQNKNVWIDSDYIPQIVIQAENTLEALKGYQKRVNEKYFMSISDNAIKNRSIMCQDTKDGQTTQIGYVITGSTDVQNSDTYKWTLHYFDLWVQIAELKATDFS